GTCGAIPAPRRRATPSEPRANRRGRALLRPAASAVACPGTARPLMTSPLRLPIRTPASLDVRLPAPTQALPPGRPPAPAERSPRGDRRPGRIPAGLRAGEVTERSHFLPGVRAARGLRTGRSPEKLSFLIRPAASGNWERPENAAAVAGTAAERTPDSRSF